MKKAVSKKALELEAAFWKNIKKVSTDYPARVCRK
jgi:hypothetical protein